ATGSREEARSSALRCDLASGEVEILARSMYGAFPLVCTPDHSRVVCADQYLVGDFILYEPDGVDGRKLLYGTPLDEREPGVDYPLAAFNSAHATASGGGLLLTTALFDDAGSPGYLDLSKPGEVEPVAL